MASLQPRRLITAPPDQPASLKIGHSSSGRAPRRRPRPRRRWWAHPQGRRHGRRAAWRNRPGRRSHLHLIASGTVSPARTDLRPIAISQQSDRTLTPDPQPAHYQLRVDRGPAAPRIVRRHDLAHPGQVEHGVHPVEQMPGWLPLLEPDLVRHSAPCSTCRPIIVPLHPADPVGASESWRISPAQRDFQQSQVVAVGPSCLAISIDARSGDWPLSWSLNPWISVPRKQVA